MEIDDVVPALVERWLEEYPVGQCEQSGSYWVDRECLMDLVRVAITPYQALRMACVGPCREMDATDWFEYFGGIQKALERLDERQRGGVA